MQEPQQQEEKRSALAGRSPLFILGMVVIVILGTFAFLAVFMLLENLLSG